MGHWNNNPSKEQKTSLTYFKTLYKCYFAKSKLKSLFIIWSLICMHYIDFKNMCVILTQKKSCKRVMKKNDYNWHYKCLTITITNLLYDTMYWCFNVLSKRYVYKVLDLKLLNYSFDLYITRLFIFPILIFGTVLIFCNCHTC